VDVIREFKACQESNRVLKFLGACNRLHDELNACMRQEKRLRIQKNKEVHARRRGEKEELSAALKGLGEQAPAEPRLGP